MSKNWSDVLFACGVPLATANVWRDVFESCIPTIWTTQQKADFVGQVLHESQMLRRLEENLNYTTPERIQAVWPSRFKTVESAKVLARNPEGLANVVYSGRMGNNQPGDGWKYRGRGLIMVTGKENYAKIGAYIGADLVGDPDQVSQPMGAMRASLAWWAMNVQTITPGDCMAITKRVNGGTVGLPERSALTAKALVALS